jgi:anthranilate phosphoribosyltransferase
LRVKLESNDELKGCLDSFDKYIKREELPDSLELGFSYDGKTDQPFLFPLTAGVLEAFFEKNKNIKPFDLVISGDLEQPAKSGITVKQLSNAIALPKNVHYFDRANYFIELSQLTPLRKKLYMRTIFNTVEKLLNPAHSKYAITSAFHKPYVKKYFDLFGASYENMMIIKGSEGNPEVFDDFKFWIKHNEETVEESYTLSEFGIEYSKTYEKITLEENIALINNPSEELLLLAKLNAAILLTIAKRFNTLKEAFNAL